MDDDVFIARHRVLDVAMLHNGGGGGGGRCSSNHGWYLFDATQKAPYPDDDISPTERPARFSLESPSFPLLLSSQRRTKVYVASVLEIL